MARLTSKQRFAVIFSIYVFFFLAIVCTIFFVIFKVASDRGIKRDLYLESSDIINNHLFLDQGGLIFRKDETGSSLREYLITHTTSAVFLDKEQKVMRTYGLFALGDWQENGLDFNKVEPLETKIVWRDQSLAALVIPLKNKGEVVGFMILAKSLEEFNSLQQTTVTIFLGLGIIGLVGSFVVGYLLALRAFSPLNKMIGVIENVELDKLDTPVAAEGHPKDEVVRLGEKFNEMIERLRVMAERQKAFIANASHELKTPLTRAISSLELSDVKQATKDLFHINTLLEKLLLLTKLKKDILPHNPYRLDTGKILAVIRQRFDKVWQEKGISFIERVPPSIKVTIPEEYLEVILTNLFSNATKFSPGNAKIYLEMEDSTGNLKISIRDEGVGMDQDEISRMFERFYSKGKGMETSGHGIGLSVVKQICDLYGIAINVASEKGTGTTVSLIFPIS